MRKKKSGYFLTNGRLSYYCCREIFKAALKELGYYPKDYGLHSVRAGGATSVVMADTSNTAFERLLKLHRCWKSDVVKDISKTSRIYGKLEVIVKVLIAFLWAVFDSLGTIFSLVKSFAMLFPETNIANNLGLIRISL